MKADLRVFEAFMKPKEHQFETNRRIIGYTRVSSKMQVKNYSIEEQERDLRDFAKSNSYDLDEDIIGGTYESASGDFSRKEFKKLYDVVKKSKNKPYAIAIKFINRFSRTGAGAITIVYELVEKMGVHLIETSSGLCTSNLNDKMQIYHKLLKAQEENQERLEKTIPGMKTFLQNGNWLGVAPYGYTTYGTKVKDYTLIRPSQEIIINKEGKVLKEAWQWKLQGERDCNIIIKMAELGANVTKQKISSIWRNPFYCGIIINCLIDKPVKGKWEPMVTEREFLQVNEMVKPLEKVTYQIGSFCEQRPLARFLICSQCGRPLTGYEVKKKGVHYYKCNVCAKVSLNANSTKRSKEKGINDLFLELLETVELSPAYIDPFKAQVNKMFDYLNSESKETYKSLIASKKELDTKLERMEERYAFGELDRNMYNKYSSQLKNQINEHNNKISELENKLSNHSEFIDFAISVSQNLSKYWVSSEYDVKDRIQRTVFPNGLVINPKNREYLTKNMNSFFVLSQGISDDCVEKKKGQVSKKTNLSYQVAGIGLEPMAFGL